MPVELYGPVAGGSNLTAAQTVQTQNMVALTLAGNSTSAGAGYALMSSGTVTLAGGANITLSQNGNHVTISGGAGGAFTGGVSSGGNTAGTTGTVNNGLLFFGGANITLSQSSAAGGASISLIGGAGGAFSGGVSSGGNTDGTTGTVGNGILFLGGSNVTLSQSSGAGGATITFNAGAGGSFTGGVSTDGNTAGTTGTVSNGIVFVGGTNITLSQSSGAGGGTITINGELIPDPIPGVSVGISTGGNTAGTTGFANSQYLIVGGSNITLSQSVNGGSATLTINGAAAAGGAARSMFYWEPGGASTVSQQVNGSASFQYIQVPYDISFSRVDVPILVSLSSTGSSATANIVISSGLVIYSMSGSTGSAGTLNPIAGSFGTTTISWVSNGTGFARNSGGRFASFNLASSLAAGDYYIGFQLSTANTSSIGTATTQLGNTISMLLGAEYTASAFTDFGGAQQVYKDIVWARGVASSTITATNATHDVLNIGITGASKIQGNFPVVFRNY